jgi:hypothetical protein
MTTLKRELQAIARYQNRQNAEGLEAQNTGSSAHFSDGAVPIVRRFLDRTNIPGPNIRSKVIFPLSSDHILTLVQYSVFRAVVANALYLGIDPNNICRQTTPTFNFEGLSTSDIPPNLQPTGIQTMTPHHLLLDLFPLPETRNNLLLAGNRYDSAALAADVFDIPGQSRTVERNGLVVWGEPWDAAGWEVTEGFAKKWTWVLKGCAELLRSTDYWRMQRGERPLGHVLQTP